MWRWQDRRLPFPDLLPALGCLHSLLQAGPSGFSERFAALVSSCANVPNECGANDHHLSVNHRNVHESDFFGHELRVTFGGGWRF